MNTKVLKEDKHFQSVILMVLVAVLWSLGGLLIKIINWNPVAIAGTRSAIAALVMLCGIKKPSLNFTVDKVCGSLAYAGTVICFVVASKLTTAANAILLQYTAPIYIALFGNFFLKEKAKKSDWVSIFFIILGMILFFVDNLSFGKLAGNIFGVLTGITFAFNAIFLRRQKDGNPTEILFWGNLLTALIAIPFMLQSKPDFKSCIALLILGIVQLGIPYLIYSIAIKNVTALEAVLIPVIEPVLNPIWVFIFTGEKPGMWALIGGSIVLLSVVLNSVYAIIKSKRAICIK